MAPAVPDEVTGKELDREVQRELSTLAPGAQREVGRRLVMVAELLDVEPELAWQHATVAREHAARLAVVREAVGLAAYRSGRYAEALSELRAARRMTGLDTHLPVLADCERGLGRPERALALAAAPEVARLPRELRVEMLIVAAGARQDLGQPAAAVQMLRVPELEANGRHAWVARLRMAMARAFTALGDDQQALEWTRRAAEADPDGSSGAAELLDGPEDVDFVDLLDGEPEEAGEPESAEYSDQDGRPAAAAAGPPSEVGDAGHVGTPGTGDADE